MAEHLHAFNVIDEFNREGLRIEGDTSLPAGRIQPLDELMEVRGTPLSSCLDNSPEFIAKPRTRKRTQAVARTTLERESN